MNEIDVSKLCTRIVEQIPELNQLTNPSELAEEYENIEEVFMGAMIAKGYLAGTIQISEKTIPFLEATDKLFSMIVDGEDEDEEEEEE